MKELAEHSRWMTALAAGLATATVTLPPIATDTMVWRGVGVIGFVILGLSAYCGTVAAKIYVAAQLGESGLGETLGADPEAVKVRTIVAVTRGQRWALGQHWLFVVGAVFAGLFLIANLT